MIEKSIENDVHINELYILQHRHDNEIHNATTYKEHILEKSLSKSLYNNDKLNGFLAMLQPMIIHMINSNTLIRNWFNFTVSKYDDRHNN